MIKADVLPVLGVNVTDVTMADAMALVEDMLQDDSGRSHSVYFVNAHTLNLAWSDPAYRAVLTSADRVFGDGTGVRWAARAIHRRRLRDNVNGTDLVPRLLSSFPGRDYRYFLLGTTAERIQRSATYASASFPNWRLVGQHHGYVSNADSDRLVAQINEAAPHLLLVGMGNPRQENWIYQHRDRLRVPVCMGVGGLLDYWSGDLTRAPRWVRAIGYEWAHLLVRQPHKARRYLMGNPQFLMRVARTMLRREEAVRTEGRSPMDTSRSRWIIKKSARQAMLSSWTVRRMVRRRALSNPTVRVLTYHRFGEDPRDPWCVSAKLFEAQVRWLSERKLALSLDDLIRFSRGEIEVPDGAVLITSDDGYSSVATIAAPLLAKYQVPAVAFITTSLVGRPSVEPDDPFLNWDQIARLPESGVAIGSHAHRHVSLGRLPLSQAREEAEVSRSLLMERTGLKVDAFAYPYGMHPDETPQTRQMLAEVGYRCVFIAQHGIVRHGTDLLRIPRVKVEGGEPAWMFPLLCDGGMDAWKAVDNSLWRLQRPEPERDLQE